MSKPFKGVINVDIKDSVPDWGPYTQPIAPEGTPNVLYIVLDDVGYSAMEPFGGRTGTCCGPVSVRSGIMMPSPPFGVVKTVIAPPRPGLPIPGETRAVPGETRACLPSVLAPDVA